LSSIARLVSLASLVATIVPPALFLGGGIELDQVKTWMLVGTVGWFAATPLWMKRG
jgi:hypothetical protein